MRRSLELGNNYALITNDDAVFTPNAIKEMYEFMKYKSNAVLVSPNQNRVDPNGGPLEGEADFFCFIVDIKRLTERVGWFDENFFPAYFEDNDMHLRIGLAGEKSYILSNVQVNHVGSATQNFDPGSPVVPPHMFDKNKYYFVEKWGGQPGGHQYHNPFNNPENDVKHWVKRDA